MSTPTHPPAIALAPRPWLTRKRGECAFPVGGESFRTIACCNVAGEQTYCPAHRATMRGPPAPSVARLEAAVMYWLGERP
jgi:hypothetical protein